jgi:hypothetical protein
MATTLYNHVFGVFGNLARATDTRLTSAFAINWMKLFVIRAKKSLPYRPQTDGSTERFNRTLIEPTTLCESEST